MRWTGCGCIAFAVALLALPACTTTVHGQAKPAPYAGGPVTLASPLVFRPTTGTAAPSSTDDCPADPGARPRDTVSAPDSENALCYPLGPAVVEVRAVTDLSIVGGTAGPGLRLSLIEDDQSTFAEYTFSNQGQQLALLAEGVVLTAPVIQGTITGPLVIAGDFEQAELAELIESLVEG